MAGMHAFTGRTLTGTDHVAQSLRDILSTPVGSRVMRREYGSMLPELLDQPLNDATLLRAHAAAVMAITRWEPRIRINTVRLTINSGQRPGRATLAITGTVRDGESTELQVTAA
ncbi:MAG: GPW/gp25 family protein [Pseudohongiellaceae bacterium]